MGPGRAMVGRVYQVLTDRYGPSYRWGQLGYELPPGLRLEIHPLTRRMLLTDPDVGRWDLHYGRSDELAEQFRVPVRITTDIPAGSWRLVIVTEELIDDGTLIQEVRGAG